MRRKLSICCMIACILLLAGCNSKQEIPIYDDGAIHFALDKYKIEEQGFGELFNRIEEHEKMPEIFTVAYFSGNLTKKGYLQDFQFTLYSYNQDKECLGMYHIVYQHENKKLYIDCYSEESDLAMAESYNVNNEITHLDTQLKRLPLEKQISMVNFSRYVLSYDGTKKLNLNDTIIDGSDGKEFPILTMEEYNNGQGGYYDGHTAVIFVLYDGISSISDDLINYRCDAADTETLYGNSDFTMECDYYVNNGEISFTRDYGETWIKADIPESDLNETLDFYRSGVEIPEFSYSITPTSDTIAFFYGESPILRISKDNGVTWSDIKFNQELFAGLSVTQRVVHFFDEKEGYVGLGTGWTMGTGEVKYCMVTHDGGETWLEYMLPLTGTSKLLTGLSFSDMEHGVISLKSATETDGYSLIYVTEDGGENWTEVEFGWEELPEDMYSISKVVSLEFDQGGYTLVLGQGSTRVSYVSTSLLEGWTFESVWTSVTHTVG